MATTHHQRGGSRPTLRNEDLDPAITEVSRKVIGCAIEVHTAIGPGFDQTVYENALSAALKRDGVAHTVGHEFPVQFAGQRVGSSRASMFVDDKFIVSVVADEREVSGFARSALRAQLRCADLGLGLIINFHRRRLKDGGLVRVLNPDKIESIRGDHGDHGDYDDYDDDDHD